MHGGKSLNYLNNNRLKCDVCRRGAIDSGVHGKTVQFFPLARSFRSTAMAVEEIAMVPCIRDARDKVINVKQHLR